MVGLGLGLVAAVLDDDVVADEVVRCLPIRALMLWDAETSSLARATLI